MKWRIEKKYIKIGAIALGVIILAIVFNYILENEAEFAEFKALVSGTLSPILVGFIMAYLLNPVLKFFERFLFTPFAKLIFRGANKEMKQKKLSRSLGILFTMIFFLVILVGGLYMVIPQVYQSLSNIVKEAPGYYNKLNSWVSAIGRDDSEFGKYFIMALDRGYLQAIAYLNENILPNMDKIVAGITSGIVIGVKAILNSVLAVIISVYVMLEKETLISVGKKLTYSMFTRKNANSILKGVRFADRVFGGFINGKIIDSFIIGVICYVFMLICEFDYAVLISIIVGVTNVIPYFGPFIGGIPSVLILLMMDVKQGFIFAIFIIILQQVDGNIIGPVILGDRLNLSSMWILFAILIGGGFFGVPGMILGAPCFACLYAFVGTVCKSKLTAKNLPIRTEDYLSIESVMAENDDIVLKLAEQEEVRTEEVLEEVPED